MWWWVRRNNGKCFNYGFIRYVVGGGVGGVGGDGNVIGGGVGGVGGVGNVIGGGVGGDGAVGYSSTPH